MPNIEARQTEDGIDYVLMPDPIGNRGACDCFIGETMRSAANRYRDDSDPIGELGANITSPAAELLFDLIVHRDLDFALKPEVLVFGRVYKDGERAGTGTDPSLLPIRPPLIELAGSPPAISTPLFPGYADILDRVYEGMEWTSAEFSGVRVQLKYPQLNSTVLMRFELPAQE